MKRTGHKAKTSSAKTGLFATLSNLLHNQGMGTTSTGRCRRSLTLAAFPALLLLLLLLALGSTSALAAVPPQSRIELWGARPTRAAIRTRIVPGESPTEWALQDSTEPANPASWTTLESGTVKVNTDLLAIYHGLTPKTKYFLRIVAKNAVGTNTETAITILTFGEKDKVESETKAESFITPAVIPPDIFSVKFLGFAIDPVRHGPSYVPPELMRCAQPHGQGTVRECQTRIEVNGAAATYHFEYAPAESNGKAPAEASAAWQPFTTGAEGSISKAEEFAEPEATVSGLTLETLYYARVKASNEAGPSTAIESFQSGPAKPFLGQPEVSNVTATSAHLAATFKANNFETEYRLEYASSESGPWAEAPGGSGTILAAEANEEWRHCTANLTGLSPAHTYYTRLFAKNSNGVERTSSVESFKTAGPPSATTFAVHVLHGETLRALGAVVPGGAATREEQTITVGGGATGGSFTLSFEGHTTAPIPFITHETAGENFENNRIEAALRALPNLDSLEASNVRVTENFLTNTYTVQFVGPLTGKNLPPLTADASGLTPSGTVTVTTVKDGATFEVGYHFEYLSQRQFSEEGEEFKNAASTPQTPLETTSATTELPVGADLPGLEPGETYRYRLAATNSTPGNPVVAGAEQTLLVPAPTEAGPEAPCPNEALRTGASARLPDCRAYEQVTPVDKKGAQDTFKFSPFAEFNLVGEDGDHFELHALGLQWGPSPDPTQGRYFFSRDPQQGWQMTSARPLGETGPLSYQPELFNSDLTQVGLAAQWGTTGFAFSPEIAYEVGPPGGPYTLVASVPRKKVGGGPEGGGGWADASSDFSKLILQVEDRELVEPSTGTKSGFDLYEYSNGELRQANVIGGSPGTKISTCGAKLAALRNRHKNQVSVDGSHVFFVDNCTHHLYVRIDGAATLDLGEYRFEGASAAGTEVLLKNGAGERFLYEAETATYKHLVSPAERAAAEEEVIPPPRFPYPAEPYELPAELAAFGGGSTGENTTDPAAIFGTATDLRGQILRYDRAEQLLQCISCASAFNPEPKRPSYAITDIGQAVNDVPGQIASAANGDYAFFDTTAALVPSDVDGEVAPTLDVESENPNGFYSPSSDVYEWRRDGLGGCTHLQGCLALISSGHGGGKVMLLGAAHEGRDVFFSTHEQLLPSDRDSSGDVYDARIGGGFAPPPPHEVECEGDSCFSPLPAPNDQTPSSSTFQGAGNLVSPLLPAVKPAVKPKPKRACRANARKRCKRKHAKRSTRPAKRSARHAAGTGRAGR